ncbi:MAG: transcription termination/antitermination NusG family protein [Candidatus Sulfotelmatobacter sp.]
MNESTSVQLLVTDGSNGIEAEVQEPFATGWFAVFTKARHEKQIAWNLGQREIESFLPLYKTKHRWKNRCTVDLELPLFPNYIFVRIDPRERLRVLRVAGVLSIVSAGREPLPVPEHYITGLRDGLLANKIQPHPGLDVGDRVRITSGAMANMVGVLDRRKNAFRVVLKLGMIGRSVAVEVDVANIESAGPAPERRAAWLSPKSDALSSVAASAFT